MGKRDQKIKSIQKSLDQMEKVLKHALQANDSQFFSQLKLLNLAYTPLLQKLNNQNHFDKVNPFSQFP